MLTRRVGAIELTPEVALAGKMICPNCGDTKFGSTRLSDGSLMRTCHGSISDEEPCAFRWPESDDHKYFYVALQPFPRSKKRCLTLPSRGQPTASMVCADCQSCCRRRLPLMSNVRPLKMSLAPTSFTPPAELRTSLFQLQVLSAKYAKEDFAAVSASAAEIRNVFGPSNDWPPENISFEENLADLKRHESEFHERKAFAYSMLDPSGLQYLGCIYIKALKSKVDPDLRKTRFQAQAFFWLSSGQRQVNADQTLVALKNWLANFWPFREVAFPGRELDWQSWEKMAHAVQPGTPEA